jgi:hypothetical protein
LGLGGLFGVGCRLEGRSGSARFSGRKAVLRCCGLGVILWKRSVLFVVIAAASTVGRKAGWSCGGAILSAWLFGSPSLRGSVATWL